MKKALYFFILSLIAVILIRNLSHISQSKTIINDLEDVLLPVKSSINYNSVISYESNNISEELYYRTQFVMVPIILENDKMNDTLLFIEDLEYQNANENLNPNEYITLQTSSNKKFRVILMKRRK